MFKWRSEKTRITAIFKLQFHATQVFEYGGNGLVVSVVPAENGKPTARLEKSTAKDNGCYWENQIYETVKLIQDPKTGKIQERIYYFLISTGSPKSSLVGEFSVNIADYVGATKPCSVSFPFKNSNSDSYLHVSIQRVQENSNLNLSRVPRDLEENGSPRLKEDDKSLRRHFSNGDAEQIANSNPIELANSQTETTVRSSLIPRQPNASTGLNSSVSGMRRPSSSGGLGSRPPSSGGPGLGPPHQVVQVQDQ